MTCLSQLPPVAAGVILLQRFFCAVQKEDGEEVPAGEDVAAEEASPDRAPPRNAGIPGSPVSKLTSDPELA